MDLKGMTDIYMFVMLSPITLNVYGKIVHKVKKMGGLYKCGIIYTKINFFEKLKLRWHIKKWIKKQSKKQASEKPPS